MISTNKPEANEAKAARLPDDTGFQTGSSGEPLRRAVSMNKPVPEDWAGSGCN